MLGVPVEIPQVQFLDKFDTPVMLARCRVLIDEVVDVPVVLCRWGSARAEDSEVIQLVPQKRVEERITEQVVVIPLPHIMDEMMEVERSTWQDRCVLRGCVSVDVVRHAFHLAQILRTQSIRSQVSSRSATNESIDGSLSGFSSPWSISSWTR